MEIRIIVFLGLVSAYAILNTAIFIAAYFALSRTTAKMTKAVSDFRNNTEIKHWIGTMQNAALEAVVVTETTKQHLAEFHPVLDRAHETYKRSLAKVDARLEDVAEGLETTSKKMRDVVAKPAASVKTFAASVANAFDRYDRD
jgi:hypothetical protein